MIHSHYRGRYEIHVLSDKEMELGSVSDLDVAVKIAKGIVNSESEAVLIYRNGKFLVGIYPTVH